MRKFTRYAVTAWNHVRAHVIILMFVMNSVAWQSV